MAAALIDYLKVLYQSQDDRRTQSVASLYAGVTCLNIAVSKREIARYAMVSRWRKNFPSLPLDQQTRYVSLSFFTFLLGSKSQAESTASVQEKNGNHGDSNDGDEDYDNNHNRGDEDQNKDQPDPPDPAPNNNKEKDDAEGTETRPQREYAAEFCRSGLSLLLQVYLFSRRQGGEIATALSECML